MGGRNQGVMGLKGAVEKTAERGQPVEHAVQHARSGVSSKTYSAKTWSTFAPEAVTDLISYSHIFLSTSLCLSFSFASMHVLTDIVFPDSRPAFRIPQLAYCSIQLRAGYSEFNYGYHQYIRWENQRFQDTELSMIGLDVRLGVNQGRVMIVRPVFHCHTEHDLHDHPSAICPQERGSDNLATEVYFVGPTIYDRRYSLRLTGLIQRRLW